MIDVDQLLPARVFGPSTAAYGAAFCPPCLRPRSSFGWKTLPCGTNSACCRRSAPKRLKLRPADRILWVWLHRLWADWKSALLIVKPETVIAWHRKGFRFYWTWKVRHGKRGRPALPQEIRDLIRMMSRNNPMWGAPRIHGELLKLGIEITEPTVAKYMLRHRQPPSQTWRTFLHNQVKSIVSVDFFTVPTIRFQVLYVFLVLAHDRRRILQFGVTAHPTAEWTVQQLRNAFHETAHRAICCATVTGSSGRTLLSR